MSETNESLDALADAYVHELLTKEEADRFERRCREEEACQQALDRSRARLAALKPIPTSQASEGLIQQTLHSVKEPPKSTRFKWVAGLVMAASVLILAGMTFHYSRLTASQVDLRVSGQTTLTPRTVASLRIQLVNPKTEQPLTDVPVHIEMERPDDSAVQLVSFRTDARGTGQPTFTVPDWADGDYELRIKAETEEGDEVIQRSVTLRRQYRVMLSSDKPLYKPGQTIKVRSLTLKKPDLTPLQNAKAVFTVRDPKGNIIFKKTETTSRFGIAAMECPLATELIHGHYKITCTVGKTESDYLVEVKTYVLPKFKVTVDLDRDWYLPGQTMRGMVKAKYFFGKTIERGQVVLSANNRNNRFFGKTFVLNQGSVPFELTVPKGDWNYKLELSAKVVDTAGQSHSSKVTRHIAQFPLKVTLVPEGGNLVRGVVNKVYVMMTYPNGAPAKGTIAFQDLRIGEVETNEHGLGEFEVNSHLNGVQLNYKARDGRGQSREGHWSPGYGKRGNFLIRADRAVYEGGQTMNLSIHSSTDGPIFLDVIHHGQTVMTSTVETKNGQGEHSFDLPTTWQGPFQLYAYRVNPRGDVIRKTRAFYLRKAGKVKIHTSFDKQTYRPGEEAKLSVRLTDEKGRPLPGALSLAAVDEAVYSVNPSAIHSETRFFLLDQELLRPVYQVYPWSPSLRDRMPADEVQLIESAAFARTVQTTSQLGSIHTLQVDTYRDKVVQTKRDREAGITFVIRFSLIMIGVVALLLYLKLCQSYPIDKVVVGHLYALMIVLPIGILLAFGGLGQKSDATFSYVGNQVGGTGGPNPVRQETPDSPPVTEPPPPPATKSKAPRPAPRLREWFPETLLWAPQIVTDDQGRAQLTIQLADSITSWRLTSSAVTGKGQLGASRSSIRVFQPFFVDMDLPASLTRNDEVAMRIVVHNHVEKKQTVTLKVKSAEWFELQSPAEITVELMPREVKSVACRIKVKKVGKHRFHVEAFADTMSDAISQEIEVVPDGHRVEMVHNGDLSEESSLKLKLPEDAIEGSAKAILKLYPSTFSQLLEGLDGIFRMPYGCFEQTSSTTYPNVLALDYLKRTGQSRPTIEAKARHYIHVGYQRLLSFEVRGGGFDWYGSPPANVALTAYGLMEFQDMAKVHNIDAGVIKRTRDWLLDKRSPNGSWKTGDRRFGPAWRGDYAMTAYVAWSVYQGMSNASGAGANTRSFLMSRSPKQIRNPYILALTCNALLALDSSGASADAYLRELESLQKSDGKLGWWSQSPNQQTMFYGAGQSGDVETTSLAVLALLKANRGFAQTRAAVSWLIKQKGQHGTWYSTQATVLALKALTESAAKSQAQPKERKIEIALGDAIKRSITISTDQAEVMQQIDLSSHLKSGLQLLNVKELTETQTGFQVMFRYHIPERKQKPRQGFAVSVAYDRTETTVGKPIQAMATIGNQTDDSVPMVMVNLPVPAGFRVDENVLQKWRADRVIDKFERTSRGVTLYVREIKSNAALSLKYSLTPTMPVKVAVPGAKAYAYYNPSTRGVSQSSRLIVAELK